jgi:hypothetical protein
VVRICKLPLVTLPLAELPGNSLFTPLALFVQLESRLKKRSRPRELEAHLYHRDGANFICLYPISSAIHPTEYNSIYCLAVVAATDNGCRVYEFLLVLDDDNRTVLARSEVYLNP